MWPFKKKEKPTNLLELMDRTAEFILRLNTLGGFGYVLFGAGFLLLVVIVFQTFSALNSIIDWLLPISAVLLALGFVVVIVDRIYSYKLAELKLKMIIEVSQQVILKTLDSKKNIDTAVAKVLVNEVLSSIWGLEIRPPERV